MTAPPPDAAALATRLAAALPQTQCTRCGYPDCAAYAQAMAQSQAEINRCPPGGAEGIARLATITARPVIALHPDVGGEAPRSVAVIDEDWCIGCTLCLAACPTDAIVGANKFMHTVVAEHCTGCALCLPVCPVDCIALDNVSGNATGWNAWSAGEAAHAKARYGARQTRLAESALARHSTPTAAPESDKQSAIKAALARSRAQRAP